MNPGKPLLLWTLLAVSAFVPVGRQAAFAAPGAAASSVSGGFSNFGGGKAGAGAGPKVGGGGKASAGDAIEGVFSYALPNGLKVLLVPEPSQPKLTVHIVYRVGSRHE